MLVPPVKECEKCFGPLKAKNEGVSGRLYTKKGIVPVFPIAMHCRGE